MPTVTQQTVIEDVVPLAPDVREIRLRSPERPIPFRPGQWVPLYLPVGERPPLVRAYSLARPLEPDGSLTLCPDRVEDGLASSYLFERQVGDPIVVGDALGNLVLPEPMEQDLLLVARFTGIVPFRCMLRSLAAQPLPIRVRLVYGAPNREALIYHAEFLELASHEPRFEYHPTLLRPHDSWQGAAGDELQLLERHAAGWRPYTPMVCGVKAFTRPMRDFFQQLGFERRAVKVEHYD
jgi:ferredoxin-NADP reductase